VLGRPGRVWKSRHRRTPANAKNMNTTAALTSIVSNDMMTSLESKAIILDGDDASLIRIKSPNGIGRGCILANPPLPG
jgi:hypothetical protein